MREGTEEKGLYRDRNRNGGRERSMEANGIAGKSVEQQENINTFPSLQRPYRLCACVCCGLWGWRGGQTCQQLLTHVSRLPLGPLLGD